MQKTDLGEALEDIVAIGERERIFDRPVELGHLAILFRAENFELFKRKASSAVASFSTRAQIKDEPSTLNVLVPFELVLRIAIKVEVDRWSDWNSAL